MTRWIMNFFEAKRVRLRALYAETPKLSESRQVKRAKARAEVKRNRKRGWRQHG